MWKATIGLDDQQLNSNLKQFQNDDWETDPDFINDITEEEQRWGSKTVKGSGHVDELVDFNKLREDVTKTYSELKISEFKKSAENSAFGYGGKFGVQNDRMDKSAHGHDYIGKTEKHASQKDYTAGFGGKFGVQSDRLDKSAVKWDHYEKVEKHSSQKDYNTGFGGKFGIEKDRQDKSAVGWNHVEKIEKHDSQKDYTHGFGGKFGIEKDRQDKSAVGWDHHETVEKHKSQLDHKVGFGGKFGVQSDRMDKCALPFNHKEEATRTIQSDEVFKKSNSIMEKKKLFESFNQKIEKVTEIKKQSFIKTETTVIKKEVILDEHKNDQIQHNGNCTEVNTKLEDAVVETIELELQISNNGQDSKIDENQMSNDRHGNGESAELSDVKEESQLKIEIDDDGVIVDTGISAIALYDYQASEEDEISFDPDDIITHVEMIDKGWWRGLCRNRYGLFPANFVQLQ